MSLKMFVFRFVHPYDSKILNLCEWLRVLNEWLGKGVSRLSRERTQETTACELISSEATCRVENRIVQDCAGFCEKLGFLWDSAFEEQTSLFWDSVQTYGIL